LRRRLSLDDMYTLVFNVYVEDEAAAEALIASVEAMDDPETALAKAIADELGMDPRSIIANPTVVQYQDGAPSSHGNTNSVVWWAISVALVITVIAVVFIITYGQYYEPSDALCVEESVEENVGTLKRFRRE